MAIGNVLLFSYLWLGDNSCIVNSDCVRAIAEYAATHVIDHVYKLWCMTVHYNQHPKSIVMILLVDKYQVERITQRKGICNINDVQLGHQYRQKK